MTDLPPVRGAAGWFARALVRLRWWVIGFWVVVTLGSLLILPSFSSGDSNGGLKGILSSDTPAVKAEKRSYELFGFPLIARTVVVQRAPGGMSPYAQARTVVRAAGVDAGKGDDVWPVLGALPITNTPGVFPGAREANTTSLTYLLFGPETSIGSRTRAAHRYAREYFGPQDHVVGITGSAPARSEQGHIIGDALPHVELATLLAIMLIVGIAFRSVVAPLMTVLTAAVAYVATLRFSGAVTQLFDLPSPDELKPVVVALLLGVVTDYVVFFCSSLREVDPELRGSREATIRAIARTGPIVLIAGFAVAAGTATLLVAKSPFFRALGPALSFTVLVGVVVAVTLVPALLAVLGELVFWPSGLRGLRRTASHGRRRWSTRSLAGMPMAPEGRRPWARALVHRLVRRRAVAGGVVAACVAGMLLAASPLLSLDLGVSFVSALPRDAPVRSAAISAQKGFSPGILSPTVVLLEGENLGRQHVALSTLGDRLSAQPGVAGVLGPESQPIPVQGGLLVSRDGNAARYLVVLDEKPLGADAVKTVDRLTAELPYLVGQSGLSRVHVGIAGDSATASFLVHQTEHDLLRIAIAAMLANVLMLLLFLRAPVTAVVLLGTSLLSLGATLGLTTALFNWLEPGQGLTFYVPFAVAVLLLAFGSDYNIFSVGHVWESLRRRTLPEAVERAYPRALRAVTAAGIALAASFGLLVLVPLLPFRQLAFGIGLGIALDIFVVRALLVPSLLSLLGPAATWAPGLKMRRDRGGAAAGSQVDRRASPALPAPAMPARLPAAVRVSPAADAAGSPQARRPPPRAQPLAAYVDQQQVICSVLDAVGGASVAEVRRELRRGLVRAGLPLPPDSWLDTVAGKISRRQLYVVAPGATEGDQHGAGPGPRPRPRRPR